MDGGFTLARNSLKICCLSVLSYIFSCSYLISKTVFKNRFFVAQQDGDKGLLDFNDEFMSSNNFWLSSSMCHGLY